MQSKRDSLIEALSNIAIGYVISYLTWILIVVPLFNMNLSHADNFMITNIFTVVSVIRSYVLRRIYNRYKIFGEGGLISNWLDKTFVRTT